MDSAININMYPFGVEHDFLSCIKNYVLYKSITVMKLY